MRFLCGGQEERKAHTDGGRASSRSMCRSVERYDQSTLICTATVFLRAKFRRGGCELFSLLVPAPIPLPLRIAGSMDSRPPLSREPLLSG